MIETNNPEINVNELMEKVRAEVKKRSFPVLKTTKKLTTDTISSNLLNIQALINNAETRSQARTKWPDKLNRFPLNLSNKFQQFILKSLNFFFKEQRVVNISLVEAGQESLAVNRELIQQIVNLQTHLNAIEIRLNNVEKHGQNIDTRLSNIESQGQSVEVRLNNIESNEQNIGTRLNDVENQGQNIDTCLNNIESHGQNVDTCLNSTRTRLNILEQDRSYIKNELGQQKSQLALFLKIANQRLTENFSQAEIQKLSEENIHSADALYVAFEDRFRGSNADITERLKIYLPKLAATNVGTKDMPILDLGCGRGEWLDLLREAGYTASGLDINRIMVQSISKELEAIEADAITYLQSLPNNCLGAVTGFHIIEHLPLPSLIDLVGETVRVLKPGGLAIFETPNPKNLVVGACNFYSDPTHRNPVFPETIQFFLQYLGLANVQLLYLNPVEDSPFEKVDPKWDILDNWFFGARDYAVIGHKV